MSQFSALSTSGFIKSGTIQITADTLKVNESQFEANTGGENGGGIIFTGKVGEFTNGSTVQSSTFGPGTAGPITFTATERLTFADPTDPDVAPIRPSGLFTTAIAGTGNAADITVKTSVLEVTGGARLDATTRTPGNGGRIDIVADVVSISGERPFEILEGPFFGLSSLASSINSRTVPSRFCGASCGNAGPISITTGSLNLAQGGRIDSSTTTAGKGGDITVNANLISITGTTVDGTPGGVFSTASATGAGGNILVNANAVTLQNAGTISAATSGTSSSATGGTITVNAEHVALNNNAVITADTNGIAPAGVVDIYAGSLAINSSGQIRSTSGAEESVVVALASAPILTGGTITIDGRTGNGSQVDSVSIDGAGSGIFTQSTGNRPGGDINIVASGSVNLTNGATISASSTGTGNAGNIQINAGNQLTMTNSTVTTEAHEASGGIIKITTSPAGRVQLTNSTISASVLDGSGGGGSVNIDPQFVILQNSHILAQAVQGPGGNISITTNLLLPDSTSLISASSQFGQPGTIVIQSPISPASGKIVPLGQKPLLPTSLLSQRCAALAGGNASSFTVAGRDSLPAEPGGWLSSPLTLGSAELVGSTATEPETRTNLSELKEAMPVVSLRRIAPPGFLSQSFAADVTTGCTS